MKTEFFLANLFFEDSVKRNGKTLRQNGRGIDAHFSHQLRIYCLCQNTTQRGPIVYEFASKFVQI